MAKPLPLPVWDRHSQRQVSEFLDDHPTTYETEPARSPMQWLESQPLYDWVYAALQHTAWSRRKIAPFVKKHGIDLSEFEPRDYRSYADFFVRKFKPGARRFPGETGKMGAFAEARYMGWNARTKDQTFPVKGHSLDAERLLGNANSARGFEQGPVLLARLSPVDYHRVHYPDDGMTRDRARLGRRLWTVNWRALQSKPDILFINERHVNLLETRHFGRLGFVEIGAMTVGRIVQTHHVERPFVRGAEKSLFCFGGSAIAVFGEPGAWRPVADILENTAKGVETMVRLGETLAVSATATQDA